MSAGAPLLVVGAGVAGLCTVLAAAPRPVVLVSRPGDDTPCTALAQGGIAAALGEGDSPARHAEDTLVAGHRLNDASAVRLLCAEAPAAIAWLQRLGLGFDRDGPSLRLAREGGHAVPRIVHVDGDATGAALLATLRRQVQASAHVVDWLHGDTEALYLRGGRACGVRLREAGGSVRVLDGVTAVVLATGGIGALFASRTQADSADGAGLALALAAGAHGRDLDRVQWHPTALDIAGGTRLALVSEAVRGAGARLRDAEGRLLMAGRHPMVDLAPRDVVAAAVAQARIRGGAWLDARCIGADWSRRFPGIFARLQAAGIDPRAQPIPVREAVHFHMGGIATDLDGRTAIPGLLAVGEAACNGVHGGNRLASNSLLEGLVFGRRVGLRQAFSPAPAQRGAERWVERGPAVSAPERTALGALLDRALGPHRDPDAIARATAHIRAFDGWEARLALGLLDAAGQRLLASTFRPAGIAGSGAWGGEWGAGRMKRECGNGGCIER